MFLEVLAWVLGKNLREKYFKVSDTKDFLKMLFRETWHYLKKEKAGGKNSESDSNNQILRKVISVVYHQNRRIKWGFSFT